MRWSAHSQNDQQDKVDHRANLSPLLGCAALGFAAFVALSYRTLHLHLLIHDGMLAPLFLVVIVALTYGNSVVHRVLSYRWLVVLGEASYGLYLIHIPLWHLLKPIHRGHSLQTYPFFLALAIGLSVLSFYYLEAPSRRFILSKFETRPNENPSRTLVANRFGLEQ
ncbi:acyltransferase family protein [Tunturiibacter empetritectus]|uniref:acyltransferase family protein n=1 Tax=Tunturiibacter empetritectus TaxID=3069691 RepID=UPI003D9BD0DE